MDYTRTTHKTIRRLSLETAVTCRGLARGRQLWRALQEMRCGRQFTPPPYNPPFVQQKQTTKSHFPASLPVGQMRYMNILNPKTWDFKNTFIVHKVLTCVCLGPYSPTLWYDRCSKCQRIVTNPNTGYLSYKYTFVTEKVILSKWLVLDFSVEILMQHGFFLLTTGQHLGHPWAEWLWCLCTPSAVWEISSSVFLGFQAHGSICVAVLLSIVCFFLATPPIFCI